MKSKAEEVLKMADIIEAADLQPGDNVKFKAGHSLAGTFGKVGSVNQDGTISVFVGKALQAPCAPGELEKIDYEAQNKVAGQNTVSAPADTTATPAAQ